MLVATRSLPAGLTLTADDLMVQWRSRNRLSGRTFTDKNDIIGARLRMGLQAQSPVLADNLCVVCRGDTVSIRAGSDGLQITATGTAITNGTFGDHVQVRNNGSGQIVEAKVESKGQVSVNF